MRRLLLLAAAMSLQACSSMSSEVAGNSASTGNAQASGIVVHPDGRAAGNALVRCRPDTLLPWANVPSDWNALTDSLGRWSCTQLPSGRIGIEARDPRSGTGRWRAYPEDSAHRIDTLAPSGTLHLAFAPGAEGTVILPGTSIALPVVQGGEWTIPGIAAGWRGAVLFLSETSALKPDTLVKDVAITAGGDDSAGFTRASAVLRLSLGEALTQPLADVPVFLRLDASHLDFSRSYGQGRDLRVRDASGTSLPVQVVRWDSAMAQAEIWTRVSQVAAGSDSLELGLDYGLPLLPGTDSVLFTGAGGWRAAWGMEEATGKVKEVVGGLDGTPSGVVVTRGVVGNALRFDGQASSFVRVEGSASGALALGGSGAWTFSAWVRLADFLTSRHVMGKGEYDQHLKFQKGWGAGGTLDSNLWFAKECRVRASGNGGYFTTARADTGKWTHLAVTMRDSVQELYVDGLLADSGSRWDPDSLGRDGSLDFMIGAAATATGTGQNFVGEIDEVQVMGVVRSREWIRLQAWTQAPTSPRARKVR